MSDYQLTEADRAIIGEALARHEARRAAYLASLTPEQRAELAAQQEASRREVERWRALSPEDKALELEERHKREEEFWANLPQASDETLATFVSINSAGQRVQRAFATYGRLRRRDRKRIERAVRSVLRKSKDTPRLKVRIYLRKNKSSRKGIQGALEKFFGEYTAVLHAWDPADPEGYFLRASLASPSLARSLAQESDA